MNTRLGLAFPPSLPPERIRPVLEAAVEAGLDEVWFSEDCFKSGGVSAVASALAWTEGTGLAVGAGLLPVPLRNVAATAMEAATLERLHPGRFRLCIGHGVQPWMQMTGAAVGSPLTLLREYAVALRGLLAGERVTADGRCVRLDGVELDHPPKQPLPVHVGAAGPRTLRLAGEVGDGTALALGFDSDGILKACATTRETGGARHPVSAPVMIATGDRARQRLDSEPAAYGMQPGLGVAGGPDDLAEAFGQLGRGGLNSVIAQPTGDDPDLDGLVRMLGRDVRPTLAAA
ncbi:LLM class flavin-dependent oxidoreductase [Kribbella albertanoniae]|uniref:LLM class flavin-dependent oxidoreductase n=1 Tax=Kribbella albertanoniae TaxID=1266829 RepID=A0A4V2XSY0_9ACTN|nr:LLM class flavin-dependent oxidoreductase [Kribbella albertanoniae]TDC35445.1 LLM class flavin-dependent oxidoreductase [Kribbella albertanoniae]